MPEKHLKRFQNLLLNFVVVDMKIKVLAEGSTQKQRAMREWGISLLIDEKMIFDTFGNPELLEKNIKKNNIDLKKVENIIISHNHWDHISGLKYILMNSKHIKVFLPEMNEEVLKWCKMYGADIILSDTKGGFVKSFFLTGSMKGKLKSEYFMEQGMILKSKKGYVLLLGCSHPGVIKMVKRASKIVKEPIHTIIGGLHLKDMKSNRVQNIAVSLKKLGVKKVIAGHCTGEKSGQILKKIFKTGYKKLVQDMELFL